MPLRYVGWERLVARFDSVRDLLSNHHDGDVGVGANAVRHDGGVGDPQTVQSVYLTILVYDGHRVGSGAHLGGA